MTTSTPTLGHRRNGRGLAHAIDHAVARTGIALLRWANKRSRRRVLSHEAHSTLRTLESARTARELDAARLTALRVY